MVNRKSTNPLWLGFEKAYKAEFDGRFPSMATIPPLNGVYLLKAGVEALNLTGDPGKLKEERQSLMNWMHNVNDFPGITDTFDIVDCLLQGPAYLFQVEDNDIVLVKRFER